MSQTNGLIVPDETVRSGLGTLTSGLALLRLALGRLRDFGDILSALGAVVLGGAVIAAP